VGTTTGGVYIYSHLVKNGILVLKECCFRKDFQEEISDVKFSPTNTNLAVGSHDDFVIVYTCALAVDDSVR
jgi:WD40 repeat protein